MKIIQINGFRGILMAAFVVSCLFAGFVIFPGYLAMAVWNKYLVSSLAFPVISLFQGILLWGITAVSYYIIVRGELPLSFAAPDKLSDAELNMIMKQAKISSDMRKINNIIRKADSFEKSRKIETSSNMTSPMNEKHEDDENIKIGNFK